MALGTPVVAATAYSANGGTTVTPAYPSGILATDVVLLFVGQKPSTANSGTVTTPTGWTLRDSLTAAGGYGTTLGADTGNTNLRVYSWDSPVAGQTGNLTVTLGTNNITWAFMVRVPSGGGSVSFGSADGQRTTTPTSPMSIALTNGATATNFQAGDLAIWAMCIPTDVTTPGQFSAQSITATGATFATAVELNEPDSNVGNDIGGYSAYASVSSGSSTAAPTVTTNLAGTLTNVRGPVVLLRIRETTTFLTQGTRFTNTPAFFGPTAQATNSVTPALFTNTPQFYSPTVSLTFNQTLTQNTTFTNTPQFFAATSASPVTLSQIAFGPSNSFNYSEQLNVTAGGWDTGGAVSVTADTTTAPDGTTTADSFTYNSGTGFRYLRQGFTCRPNQYYTLSVYVKKNNYRYIGVRPANLGPGVGTLQEHCVFDFDTESFVYTPPTSGIVSTGFVNVGNGWYRIYATAQIQSDRGGFRVAGIALTDANGNEQSGTLPPAGSVVYVWGAQLELSTAPSTYVQTVATAPLQQQVPNVFFASTVTQTGATQNLTPALYTNTPQFFSATATATNTLTPARYTNTPQFFAATITQTGGTQTLTPALYTNTPQFFAATVTASRTLTPALYTNTPQFFGPTVTTGAVNLSPALYTNTPQFFGAAITQDGFIAQNTRFTNTPQFFTATVTAGPVTLTQNTRFTNTPQFFTATITSVLTQSTRYTNTPQFFAPTATATNTLTPALYTNTPQFFAATLTATRTLTPALYTNTPQFFAHTVTPGAVALTQATRFTNTPQFFGGTVVTGQGLVQATRYTNTPQFFAPNLTNVNALTPALYTNTPAFFTASLTVVTPLVQATRFTNTPQFFGGTVQQGQFLTFENYVVAGYVDPPGYVEYIAYFNNVFFTGNLELQIAVSGLQATGFVGTVGQTLESVIVPTGVQAVGGVGYVNIWGLVDDSQSAGWQNIDITQSVTWSAVIDSQTASWQDVDVTQGPGWQDEGACIC